MCGACRTFCKFNEELANHILTKHQEIPDGTIYGVVKEKLFKFFGLPIVNSNQRDIRYRCGCGKIYGCSSSLKIHIIKKHGGRKPEGTKGGKFRNPKNMVSVPEK